MTEKEALQKIGDYVGKTNVQIDYQDKNFMNSEDAFKTEYERRVKALRNPKTEYISDPHVAVPEGEWSKSSDGPVIVDAQTGNVISEDQICFRQKISELSEEIKNLLFYKNMKYGNSALNPLNIFNKDNSVNGILMRIDDKLSRIKNEVKISPNDVIDLIGYLYLLLVDMNIDKKHFERLKD